MRPAPPSPAPHFSAPAEAPAERFAGAERARVRRFGLLLAGVIVALVLAAVGYVVLFDRVLADPSLPPTAGTLNPRVLIVELLVLALVAVAVTAAIVRARRRG
ncbi:MAG: hypothetical protein FJ293_10210 [Planctomycetes bacterium]|nr:hypothetical protein [Planctomycetota bacterium]